jgi:hypothetical protein
MVYPASKNLLVPMRELLARVGMIFALSGLPYVVKEFVDSGSCCRGPVGEMEYYRGWNTDGD